MPSDAFKNLQTHLLQHGKVILTAKPNVQTVKSLERKFKIIKESWAIRHLSPSASVSGYWAVGSQPA